MDKLLINWKKFVQVGLHLKFSFKIQPFNPRYPVKKIIFSYIVPRKYRRPWPYVVFYCCIMVFNNFFQENVRQLWLDIVHLSQD